MLFELVAARAQRREMPQGGVRIAEEAQRDPAGEKLRFDIGIAGHQAVLGGDLVGDAGMAVVQRAATIDAPLGPPIVEVEQDVGLARRIEQHLPSFFPAVLVLGATQPLDAIEAQADIGFDRVRGQRIEQLAGVAAAFDHGDAGGDLLLLGGGQQFGHSKRRFGRSLFVGIEQPVDARLVMLGRQHAAVAVEDLLLHRGIELMVAPRRDRRARAPRSRCSPSYRRRRARPCPRRSAAASC